MIRLINVEKKHLIKYGFNSFSIERQCKQKSEYFLGDVGHIGLLFARPEHFRSQIFIYLYFKKIFATNALVMKLFCHQFSQNEAYL